MPANEQLNQALTSPADDLALIAGVAATAGDLALAHFHRGGHDITWKGGVSPVTAADIAVDRYLRDTLRAARPDYGWLSEETADTAVSERMAAPRTFVVDPIDGTRGFIDGRRQWCVSVAVVEKGRPIAGVLVCPALAETLTAIAGGGAFLNGQRLGVEVSTAIATVGGPRPLVDMHSSMAGPIERYGHVPSLAYRIALIAMNRLDATYVKPSANDWDVAAADLVLEEAGGVLADRDGRALVYNGASPLKNIMVACRPDLLATMLAVVAA